MRGALSALLPVDRCYWLSMARIGATNGRSAHYVGTPRSKFVLSETHIQTLSSYDSGTINVYRSRRARTPPPDGPPGSPDSARSVRSFWPFLGPGAKVLALLVGPYVVPPGGRRMAPRLKTTIIFGRALALTAHFVSASWMIQTSKHMILMDFTSEL